MPLVSLPTSPMPRSVKWQLIDFGTVLRGALGGADQKINRLGARWQAEIELPVMSLADARTWAAALASAQFDGASWRIDQLGLSTGTPGTPLVNGGAQAGRSLTIDGLTAGYRISAGQWLSILTGGQRYLYQASAAVIANASGQATVPLSTALRVQPADNDPVELALPVMEGLLDAAPGWSLDPDWLARGFTFVVAETR